MLVICMVNVKRDEREGKGRIGTDGNGGGEEKRGMGKEEKSSKELGVYGG